MRLLSLCYSIPMRRRYCASEWVREEARLLSRSRSCFRTKCLPGINGETSPPALDRTNGPGADDRRNGRVARGALAVVAPMARGRSPGEFAQVYSSGSVSTNASGHCVRSGVRSDGEPRTKTGGGGRGGFWWGGEGGGGGGGGAGGEVGGERRLGQWAPKNKTSPRRPRPGAHFSARHPMSR